MKRLLASAIVLCALLSAAPVAACVPGGFMDPVVYWTQAVKTDSLLGVCPSGDWSGIEVTLYDLCAMPVAGKEVVLTLADGRVCDSPVTAITDMYGHAHVVVKLGLNSSAGTARVGSAYSLTCMGLTIRTGTASLVSPDYNCNQSVDALDFSFFALDWLPAAYAARSDFNDDKVVDALDFSIFALHWLHSN